MQHVGIDRGRNFTGAGLSSAGAGAGVHTSKISQFFLGGPYFCKGLPPYHFY